MNEEIQISSKKKKIYSIVLLPLVALVILGGLFIFFSRKQTDENKSILSAEVERTFRISEVILHNTKEDCWLVIENEIYDITGFITKHPGGEIIVSACGTDATEKFNNRPITGTSHSALARKILQSLRLGSLSN